MLPGAALFPSSRHTSYNMYHVKLRFFGGDPHVPKPCQIGAGVFATAYWSIPLNCHETPPIPAADYEANYRLIPDRWRVFVEPAPVVIIEDGNLGPVGSPFTDVKIIEDGNNYTTAPTVTVNSGDGATYSSSAPAAATPPTDGVNTDEAAAEASPAKPKFRELRAQCRELNIPVPANATTEQLQALLDARSAPAAPETA